MLDAKRLGRIRWRCRRGRLENDLVLSRFLDRHESRLTEQEVEALDRLLDLADDELWDLVSGRVECEDDAVKPLVATLRNG